MILLSTHVAGIDGALVLELSILDPLDGELCQGRIAVLVEAPGAEDAIEVLGGEICWRTASRVASPSLDALSLAAVKHHVGRLISISGIGLDRVVVLALVVLDELLARFAVSSLSGSPPKVM